MIKNKTLLMEKMTERERDWVGFALEVLNERFGSDVNGVVYCEPYVATGFPWFSRVNMTVKLDGYCVGYDMDFLYYEDEDGDAVLDLLEIRTRYE
jgi:hypothetical protein